MAKRKSKKNKRKRLEIENMLGDVVVTDIRADNLARNKFFIFELLDPVTNSKDYIAKLGYIGVFSALDVLSEHCVETTLFAHFGEMLESVAVSPQTILFDEKDDISDFYYFVGDYIDGLCEGFFNSKEDMLDLVIDEQRLRERMGVIDEYKDIAHVLVQLFPIFQKAYCDNKTVLVYADFMNYEFILG